MSKKANPADTVEHCMTDKFPAYKAVPLAGLIPYARNSRTHSDAQVSKIAASIREFGFLNPVIVDGENGIIAGHGRVMAAQKLGMELVPIIEASHLTDAQRRAYVIADNRLALDAGWDDAMLRVELADLESLGFDLDLTGFTPDEIEALEPDEVAEWLTDEDAVPDVQDEHVTKLGDVWLLGNHRLMCGDSTSITDVDTLMAGFRADMVWTDPPYNVAIQGKAGSIMNDDMSASDFRDFLAAVYSCYFAVMREGAVIYVAHADSERAAFTDTFVHAGLKLSQVLIWVKQSATLSRQDFNWQHEPILYGWKEGAGHYFCSDFTLTTVIDDDVDLRAMKREQLVDLISNMRSEAMTTAIRYARPTKSDLHPTMKPVGLVQRMIEWSSRKGEVVLDLFGGSGSTLIACEKTGRHARLMELDPKYCDVIVKRYCELTGKEAVLESSGSTYEEVASVAQSA